MIAHDEEQPKIIQHALSSPKAKVWFEVMKAEMNSMESNRVWDIVDLSPGRKSIGNKWVISAQKVIF